MPSIFRSENVDFCQLIIPNECEYTVIRSIGELECMQFLDRNAEVPAFSRKFTQNILWCEEMERKLRFLDDMLKQEKLTPFDSFYEFVDAPDQNLFNELENEIDSIVNQITQSNTHLADLRKGYNELVEYRHILRYSDKLDTRVYNTDMIGSINNITVINGVIARSRVSQFEQFLWRASRGNVFLRHVPIDQDIMDAVTGEKIAKCVFLVYLQGDQLVNKVTRICETFQASTYVVPISPEEKNHTLVGLITRIKDVELVLYQTADQRKILFNEVCKSYNIWRAKVIKIKAIFATLNLFSHDNGSRTLVAECWCPSVHVEKVRATLSCIQTSESSDLSAILNVIRTTKSPPTYFLSDKVSMGFQNLVDAYGVGAYKEVNPALYMVITFPFIFSVMFGDFGHSIFIVLAGLVLIIKENSLCKYKNNEMFSMIFSGRYIIFLMGMFSLYSGLIYNDIFSKSVYIWPSSWSLPTDNGPGLTISGLRTLINTTSGYSATLDPGNFYKGDPYPIGLDPIWTFSSNQIIFVNSIKMKISVILGFFQMLFGILLSAVNHRYFNHKLEFYGEFVPQIIFFLSIFGYLVFMIFFKWIYISSSNAHAPSILLAFINMFISFGKSIPASELLYNAQERVEPILVVIALLCVPWLLCVKPIGLLLRKRRNRLLPNATFSLNNTLSPDHGESTSQDASDDDEDESKKPTGEILIMQLIHTIEFSLGCISNTASYLRLWALSLAHNQLSELLWSMVLHFGFGFDSFIGSIFLFILAYAFIILTIGILVLMEGLSTFLHALRLHWVEFQNKFYAGSGSPLIVFSLKKVVEINSQ